MGLGAFLNSGRLYGIMQAFAAQCLPLCAASISAARFLLPVAGFHLAEPAAGGGCSTIDRAWCACDFRMPKKISIALASLLQCFFNAVSHFGNAVLILTLKAIHCPDPTAGNEMQASDPPLGPLALEVEFCNRAAVGYGYQAK